MVAAAAALLEKSARLSTRQWEGAAAALEKANALRVESFGLIEEDAQAFLAFVEAVRADPRFAELRAHIWRQLHTARPPRAAKVA